MTDIAIHVEGLSKRYRIGLKEEKHDSLTGSLGGLITRPASNLRRLYRLSKFSKNGHDPEDVIWAVKNVSFEVKKGEVIGIIGRNGAGKSTLLKILSRITEPTEGHATINGRVGALLEVGTGMHPELTGRDNVYLNGAVLGMSRKEIHRKFDEIVEFSGVEKFIDTPLKRYSSGMKVRLAFAVAVHLEPEVLIVDEVLAVGDAQFQKKCFNKMREVGGGGRTILFVSHNMSAVRQICHRGFILDDGFLVEPGPIDEVVDKYLAGMKEPSIQEGVETESFSIDAVQIRSTQGPVIKTFDPVEIRVTFTAKTDIQDPGLYIGILSSDGQRLTGLDFGDFRTLSPLKAGDRGIMGFSIDELPLLPGEYQLEVIFKDLYYPKFERIPRTFAFEIADSPVYHGRKIDSWYGSVGLHAKTLTYEASEKDSGRC